MATNAQQPPQPAQLSAQLSALLSTTQHCSARASTAQHGSARLSTTQNPFSLRIQFAQICFKFRSMCAPHQISCMMTNAFVSLDTDVKQASLVAIVCKTVAWGALKRARACSAAKYFEFLLKFSPNFDTCFHLRTTHRLFHLVSEFCRLLYAVCPLPPEAPASARQCRLAAVAHTHVNMRAHK